MIQQGNQMKIIKSSDGCFIFIFLLKIIKLFNYSINENIMKLLYHSIRISLYYLKYFNNYKIKK